MNIALPGKGARGAKMVRSTEKNAFYGFATGLLTFVKLGPPKLRDLRSPSDKGNKTWSQKCAAFENHARALDPTHVLYKEQRVSNAQ